MDLDDLPLELMHDNMSSPTKEALDSLEVRFVIGYILNKYPSPEDSADAFDGAFTGYHIQEHLTKGADEETWLAEVLGWYDWFEHKNLDGPFFDGLKTTLGVFGFGDFYRKSIDFIIEHKGEMDPLLLFEKE